MRAGESVAEARKKLADADLDIPLLVDDDGRPKGWLSERGLQGERVREELRSPADPIVELDDILRDALSNLLSLRHPVRAGRRRQRLPSPASSRSRSSPNALSHAPDHIPTASELAAHELAAEEAASWTGALASYLPVFAQLGEDFFGDREGAAQKCPGQQRPLPGLDRR